MGAILVVDPAGELGPACGIGLESDGHQVDWWADWHDGSRPAGVDLVITTLAGLAAGPAGWTAPAATLLIGDRPLHARDVPVWRLGVDEYLLRPFTVASLHLRVGEMLARSGRAREAAVAAPRDLVRLTACSIDMAAGLVYRDGGVTPLRGREHGLLRALLRRHGRPASRGELQREVCGRDGGDEHARGIANHVVELRRKIEARPGVPRHLLTVRNGGYRLVHVAFPDRLAAAG